MRRGVSYYATAPCPATSAAPAPVFLRVAWHPFQFARQFVFFAVITFALALSPPAAGAAAEAGASTVISTPGQSAQAVTSSYGAWSCRGVYHVVRRGETLYSIARRYGTTAYRIAVCNGLASYTVYVGQTLLVPMGR